MSENHTIYQVLHHYHRHAMFLFGYHFMAVNDSLWRYCLRLLFCSRDGLTLRDLLWGLLRCRWDGFGRVCNLCSVMDRFITGFHLRIIARLLWIWLSQRKHSLFSRTTQQRVWHEKLQCYNHNESEFNPNLTPNIILDSWEVSKDNLASLVFTI